MTQPSPNKSDLGVRTLSALVMVAVAGTALWLGGWWWNGLVMLVALGAFAEWATLSWSLSRHVVVRVLWLLIGLVYIGAAAWMLANLRHFIDGLGLVLAFLGAVIATDIGAYFAGRTIGGPKIAPSISPSKTWAGLGGGMLAAAVYLIILSNLYRPEAGPEQTGLALGEPAIMAFVGLGVAIVAQAGDFLESWMKRRAGVKDSGKLLPGHGGLLDRVDGLLAVMFVSGCILAGAVLVALGGGL